MRGIPNWKVSDRGAESKDAEEQVYLEKMRRLLQLSTLVLILTVVFTPISEALDHWDPPGLSHDTEFALFAFVLCITLVLLVSQLVAMARQDLPLVSEAVIYLRCTMNFPAMVALRVGCVCTGLSPPLRI